ncbi:MAG: phytanoyl-CoA dioxygenase family protein [Pyrinomonadaceae bacterium]
MTGNLREEIDRCGFARSGPLLDDREIEKILKDLAGLRISDAVRMRNGAAYGIRDLLRSVPAIARLAESEKIKGPVELVLGKNARPVRAIFFDKTPEANWKVPWHQDITIAVRKRFAVEGFSVWTQKAGIDHVQPPVSILDRMLAVRVHLDDADETNGTLKVLPATHRLGRLSQNEIISLGKANRAKLCCIKRGEAFFMRPLLVHASSAGTRPKHRRVVHVEYAGEDLPGDLEWYGS